MIEAVSMPLRERKKAETWMALHEAAASLALQHGVEQTTVEAIAASAGVSPRTFFNYFQAKEDAILGLREPVLEASLLAEISVTADDLVGQVSRLLMTVAWTAIGGTDRARGTDRQQRGHGQDRRRSQGGRHRRQGHPDPAVSDPPPLPHL